MRDPRVLLPLLLLLAWQPVVNGRAAAAGQVRPADDSDRAAFRGWFVLLVDAAYYRPVAEVADCAALVRYAAREAFRPHTAEWRRRAALPPSPGPPDVRRPPAAADDLYPLFRVSTDPDAPLAEFADARTLIRYNTRLIARDVSALRPGDLLFFQQAGQRQPEHLMVFVGPSTFDASARDFLVYHTGPDGSDPGEMRKVRLSDLLHHPSPRWRPLPANRAFIGVFRLLFA